MVTQGIDDDTAFVVVSEAATKYPQMNNDEVYEYVREWEKVPVSRRQVALAMRRQKLLSKQKEGAV